MAYVTVKKIAAKYAIPPMTVYYYINNAGMPCLRIQGRIKLDEAQVDKWIRNGEDGDASKKVW